MSLYSDFFNTPVVNNFACNLDKLTKKLERSKWTDEVLFDVDYI